MPQDFNSYLDPGIYVDEIPSPVVSTAGISDTVIAIVADTQRYREWTEVRQLLSNDAIQLAKLGVNADTVVVKSRYTGVTYQVGVDFTLTTGSGEDTVSDTLDDTTSIARDLTGSIASGDYVTISYQFTDPDYYVPKVYTDYDRLSEIYGTPFDGNTGVINSPLSLAAFLAFENGAHQIVAVPVQAVSSTPSTNEWSSAIAQLRDTTGVNVVVPVTGQTVVHDAARTHCAVMKDLGDYRRAFVGRDMDVTISDLMSEAVAYGDSRMVVVGPGKFQTFDGSSNTFVDLPGPYAAAAVAGAHASRPVQVPLTRKKIRGFSSIPSQAQEPTLVGAQRSGVCMLWQQRDGNVVVRHGLTTNMTDQYSREINVQAAKDRMQELVLNTLDAQQLIGSVITDSTPQYVVGAVTGALEVAKSTGLINNYSSVKYRQPTTNQTLLEVRFQYKPSLPLNYISVQFAIDTNTGSIDFQ